MYFYTETIALKIPKNTKYKMAKPTILTVDEYEFSRD